MGGVKLFGIIVGAILLSVAAVFFANALLEEHYKAVAYERCHMEVFARLGYSSPCNDLPRGKRLW